MRPTRTTPRTPPSRASQRLDFVLFRVLGPVIGPVIGFLGRLATNVALIARGLFQEAKASSTELRTLATVLGVAFLIGGCFRQRMDAQQIAGLTSIIDDAHAQAKKLQSRASSVESTARSLVSDLPSTSAWHAQATDLHSDAESVESRLQDLVDSLDMELRRGSSGMED